MAVLAAPYSRDPWILSTSYAANTVGSVLGVGILALGYIAKLASAIGGIVALDGARVAVSAQLTKLIQDKAPAEVQAAVERRIQILTRQLEMLLARYAFFAIAEHSQARRAHLLRQIQMTVHIAWLFLFFAGFFALMQQWHHPFWIGCLVCVIVSMCSVLLFVCGALYETYIMMGVDYAEEAYIDSLPTKLPGHDD